MTNTNRLQFKNNFSPEVVALLAALGSERYANYDVHRSYETLQEAELGQERQRERKKLINNRTGGGKSHSVNC